ncbi:hypothetical protein [Streptomyces viridosporus]|uniref:hypothetical protein n=1 Tax=Streptomyces viridosporus TaxID=67581 RepID=UPI0009BDEAF6|nr:hypothetical protein [Streptomyces viridosporus]
MSVPSGPRCHPSARVRPRRSAPDSGRVRSPPPDALYRFLSEKVGALADVHTAETVLTLRRVKTLTPEPR